MRRQLTPKRYVKAAKKQNNNNTSASPMINARPNALKRINKDKSPISAGLEKKKDKDNEDKEIALFKKKKIRTLNKGKGDTTNKHRKSKQ